MVSEQHGSTPRSASSVGDGDASDDVAGDASGDLRSDVQGDVRGRQRRGLTPTSAGRSRNLAAIKRTDTKPEVALRSELHRRGLRFRKDYRLDLPGGRVRPDVVFTRRKVAVFVDGCFWHVCPLHGREPTSNEWYWTPKLRRNVERDRQADATLAAAGWEVVRIWEHEPPAEGAGRVESAVADPS